MSAYTMKELFGFMESGRPVRVQCKDARIFEGRCWAYGDVQNEEEYGVAEPSLEVKDTMIFLSEIEKIEFVEEKDDE